MMILYHSAEEMKMDLRECDVRYKRQGLHSSLCQGAWLMVTEPGGLRFDPFQILFLFFTFLTLLFPFATWLSQPTLRLHVGPFWIRQQ